MNVIDTSSSANNSYVNNCSLSLTITKNNNNNNNSNNSFIIGGGNTKNNKVMAVNYTVNNGMDMVKSLSFVSSDADKLHRVV